jgi:hypothetical protein
VGVLKGVVPFMADLLRAITIPVEVDFIDITRFQPGSSQRGAVRLEKDLNAPIEGRHVLFVEDVIDTGMTLNYLLGPAARARPGQPRSLCLLQQAYAPAGGHPRSATKALTSPTCSSSATGSTTASVTAISPLSDCSALKSSRNKNGPHFLCGRWRQKRGPK